MKAGFFGGKEDETLHRRSGWTGLTLHQELLLFPRTSTIWERMRIRLGQGVIIGKDGRPV